MYGIRIDGATPTGIKNEFESINDALAAAEDEITYRTPEFIMDLERTCIYGKGFIYKAVTCCDEFDDPNGYGYWDEHEIDIFVI